MTARQAVQAELKGVKDRRKQRRQEWEKADHELGAQEERLTKALGLLGQATPAAPVRRQRRTRRPMAESRTMILDYLEKHGGSANQREVTKALELEGSIQTALKGLPQVTRESVVINSSRGWRLHLKPQKAITPPPTTEGTGGGEEGNGKPKPPVHLADRLVALMEDGKPRTAEEICVALGVENRTQIYPHLADHEDIVVVDHRTLQRENNGGAYQVRVFQWARENKIIPGAGVERGRLRG